MNPDFDLRLRSMQRALTECVLPALDPADALAQEQARLLLGHLAALRLQQRHAMRLEALEERALLALGRTLIAAAAGGTETARAAARLSHACATATAVGGAIEALVLASGRDGSAACAGEIARLVLAHGKAAALRGRAWFAAMGFDAEPEALPDIDEMLTSFAAELEAGT
jgi:hypothetical protein